MESATSGAKGKCVGHIAPHLRRRSRCSNCSLQESRFSPLSFLGIGQRKPVCRAYDVCEIRRSTTEGIVRIGPTACLFVRCALPPHASSPRPIVMRRDEGCKSKRQRGKTCTSRLVGSRGVSPVATVASRSQRKLIP